MKFDMPKKAVKKQTEFVLKNVLGEDVDPMNYFYSDGSEEEKKRPSLIPSYFHDMVGMPVTDREDLIEIFNKVFKPEDNFLFYKSRNKEVYLVIIPKTFAQEVDAANEPLSGDAQIHGMSFISEGSVNPDTLKAKLKLIAGFVKYTDR